MINYFRYLASGDTQFSMAMHYRISPSAVCNIVRETVAAIIATLKNLYLPSPNEETWRKNEERYLSLWNFPNACGSIDGKHVRVKAPPGSGSLYYNYKSFFSIVLLAIADADFKFTAVDIGAYGSESDGGIFSRSAMGMKLIEKKLGIPNPKPLINSETILPCHLRG